MSFLEHIQEAYSALHGMLYAQLVEPVYLMELNGFY